jgi:hypothetical protein
MGTCNTAEFAVRQSLRGKGGGVVVVVVVVGAAVTVAVVVQTLRTPGIKHFVHREAYAVAPQHSINTSNSTQFQPSTQQSFYCFNSTTCFDPTKSSSGVNNISFFIIGLQR